MIGFHFNFQTKIGEAIKQGSITELKNALAEGENVTFQDRVSGQHVTQYTINKVQGTY